MLDKRAGNFERLCGGSYRVSWRAVVRWLLIRVVVLPSLLLTILWRATFFGGVRAEYRNQTLAREFSAHNGTPHGRSILHVMIAGIVYPYSGVQIGLPSGSEWHPTSHLEREFQNLVAGVRRGHNRGLRPRWQRFWDYLTDPSGHHLPHGSALDLDLDDGFRTDLESFLAQERQAALYRRDGSGSETATGLPALSATLLTYLNERAREDVSVLNFDPNVVPIGGRHGSLADNSGADSDSSPTGAPPGASLVTYASTGNPVISFGLMPAGAPLSGSYGMVNGNSGGGSPIARGPIYAPIPPAPSYAAPSSPIPPNLSSVAVVRSSRSASPLSKVLPNAPTVEISSRNVLVSVRTNASDIVLRGNAVIDSASSSGTLTTASSNLSDPVIHFRASSLPARDTTVIYLPIASSANNESSGPQNLTAQSTVPEPGSTALLAFGVGALFGWRRRSARRT